MADSVLQTSVREVRTRQGLSQRDLARLAGVTRQTVGGIEAGLYAPSATVALRLARALGVRVEDLFWLEEDLPEFAVERAVEPLAPGDRVSVARVGGHWVARPLRNQASFRVGLAPADGVAAPGGSVKLLVRPELLTHTVQTAGCDPALSLWAEAAERRNPGLRVNWFFAGSGRALQYLLEGLVHVAGMHLADPDTGEFNRPYVQRQLRRGAAVLINVGFWEEGLLVAPGNPKRLRSAADLAGPGVSLINREGGAGARHLLDRELGRAGVEPAAVGGYAREALSHWEVAQAVAGGAADAGVGVELVARAYGLDFVPWSRERYDLVVLKEYMDDPPVRALLESLQHRDVRTQLRAFGGYDTAQTGEVVAEVAAAPS